jgi:hypothetical protein
MKRENLGPCVVAMPVEEGNKHLEFMTNNAWFRATHIIAGDVIYFNPKLNEGERFFNQYPIPVGSGSGLEPLIWVEIRRDNVTITRLLPIRLLINERRYVSDNGEVIWLYNKGEIVNQLCLCKSYKEEFDLLLDKKLKVVSTMKRTITLSKFIDGEFRPFEKEEEFWSLLTL